MVKFGLVNQIFVPFLPNSLASPLLLILSSLLSCFTFVPSFLLTVTNSVVDRQSQEIAVCSICATLECFSAAIIAI